MWTQSMAQSVKVKASETDLCRVERARFESSVGLVLFISAVILEQYQFTLLFCLLVFRVVQW